MVNGSLLPPPSGDQITQRVLASLVGRSKDWLGKVERNARTGGSLEASMRRHTWLPRTYRSTSTSITQAPARPVSKAMTTAGAIQYSPPPRSAISVAPPSIVRTATATLGT